MGHLQESTRNLLECVDDNFLVQVLDRPARGEMWLDVVLPSAEEIIKGIKSEDSIGCSSRARVEVGISRNMGLAKSGVRTLNLERANFRLFKELLDEISWEALLRDKGVEESWLFFRDAFLRAQELSISPNKKVGRGGRKLTGLGKDLQVRLREETVPGVETRVCQLGRKQGCCPNLQRED